MSMLATGKVPLHYAPAVEEAIDGIQSLLQSDYNLGRRAVALLLLQGDEETTSTVREREGARFEAIAELVDRTASAYNRPLSFVIAMARQAEAERIVSSTTSFPETEKRRLSETLSRLTIHPLTGIPILLAVLYFGLYQFVGQFGAGTLVGLLEENLFGEIFNPWITEVVTALIPWPVIQELFVGEYGVITLAITYAVALILPIVGTFFLVFSVIEDTGYLPRLALLIDRVFKLIGLNGRAVIPMVLGLGCDTMATVVTRVMETRRERIIATLLLALAIPCSAQLGVILGLLSENGVALLAWIGVIGLIFVTVGFITARVLPGQRPSFYMELPPLRLPNLRNVLTKTYTRMEWYFLEVFPIFVLASVLIWLGQLTGVFQWLVGALGPLMEALGLPQAAAAIFLFGFFRRDYGAAGLFDLQQQGGLSTGQLLIAAVVLTLFVPCVAQFSVMLKERGTKVALAIFGFIFPFAFLVGFLMRLGLQALGVQI